MRIWQRFKHCIIWTLVFIVSINLSLFLKIPPKAGAAERPSNCQTLVEITSSVPGIPYQRCATISPAGYTIHLWHGDNKEAKGDEEFNYIGSSDFGWLGMGDIGGYIYRSKSQSDYYVAVTKHLTDVGSLTTLIVTHHYRVDQNARWDELDDYNKQYKVIAVGDDKPNLPDYKNAFDDGQRFVWRTIVNGTVTLNDNPVEGAFVKMHFNVTDGPPADQASSNEEGKFEYSLVGINEDLWINQNTVKQLVLYAGLEKNGKKYEEYYTLSFPDDFRNHENHDDAKVDNLGLDSNGRNRPVINFTSTDEVDEFGHKPGGEQSLTEEMQGDTCGVTGSWITRAIAEVLCAFIQGIAALSGWLTNAIFKGVFNA